MSEKKMRKGERTLQESWREGDMEKEGSLGYPLQGERQKEKEGATGLNWREQAVPHYRGSPQRTW